MSDSASVTRSRLKWVLPILFIVVAVGTFMLLVKSKPQAPSRPVTEKVWNVRTIAAEPGRHQPSLVLYGKVESPRMTNITAAVTAFVAEVYTDEGKAISPGELLIQLDDSDARLLVSQREADVSNVTAQIAAEKVRHAADQKSLKIEQNLLQLNLKSVRRYENLIERKVASQEQLDAARRTYQQQALSLTQREQNIADHPNRLRQLEAQLERAESLLQVAQLDLARTRIEAPFNGRVASLNTAPGDRVRAGDSLLSLYSLDRLEIRAQIPNRIIPLLRGKQSDQQVSAQGSIDGQQLNLYLDRIAAAVDGGRAGVDGFFRLAPGDYQPEPGRSLSINVDLPAIERAIPVPPMALYGLDRVYRVTDNRLEAVTVSRIGDAVNGNGEPQVLIASPQLHPGDRIVITQLPNAITGLNVKEFAVDQVTAGTNNE